MRSAPLLFAAGLSAIGCGQRSSAEPLLGADASVHVLADASAQGGDSSCPPCTTDKDCGGGVCAQLGADSYCAPVCPTGNECASDRACIAVSTVNGQQASACVPRGGGVCGAPPPGADAGPPPATCGTLVGPDVNAPCASCGAHACQANGCYGGWWCNTVTTRCQAPPASCTGGDAGVPYDGGPPVTGQIDPTGGKLSRLVFGVVGDTRPANPDDTPGYPTAIITKIFSDLEALPTKPPFVVSTGDYIFASTSGAQVDPQFDLYLGARANYSGLTFPAMGNHECTGATASNCGAGTANGTTANFTSFLTKMLGPIQKTDPYYAIRIDALDGSWTSKLVFVAANAWTPAQATWLDQALATPTTYTFVLRHESAAANTAPGVDPSEQIMAAHPYTLALVGHTHTYEHFTGREVIVGNGGAPLTGSKNFGFAVVNQRPDGAIAVDMIDYASGLSDSAFRFAVKSDGSPAP